MRLLSPGRISYAEGIRLQERLVAQRGADEIPDTLLLLEHDPVVVLGRGAHAENLLVSPYKLTSLGVELATSKRGGDVTYHNPGQLVGYAIVDLALRSRDLHEHLRGLEDVVLRALGRIGIDGRRVPGKTGVFVGEAKVASIGIAVRNWVAYHGFALNVCNDLDGFSLINPCGFPNLEMTSVSRVLNRSVAIDEIIPHVTSAFEDVFRGRSRFPAWLTNRVPCSDGFQRVRGTLASLDLRTVCESADCPNAGICFSRGTATFMILGPSCTRHCRFCSVAQRSPEPVEGGKVEMPDSGEPGRIAGAARELGLRYVVVTSPTRDDLVDGGARQYVATMESLRAYDPAIELEVLVPDFSGSVSAVAAVAGARPNVFAHNVETVPRLYSEVRPQASYDLSLAVLAAAKGLTRKSGLMLGLGEERDEVLEVMRDLRAIGVEMLTLGQYLKPAPACLEVNRFVPPGEFDDYARAGREMGFSHVASAPFVRSSYLADQAKSIATAS